MNKKSRSAVSQLNHEIHSSQSPKKRPGDNVMEACLGDIPYYEREIHIRNIPNGLLNKQRLYDFFCDKIREAGLWDGSESPVVGLQLDIEGRFAFLCFQSEDLTTQCLQFDQTYYFGQKMYVERPKKWVDARTLFVGNIPHGMTEDRLREFLSHTMNITGMIHSTGKSPIADVEMSKGFAFVTFNTPEETTRCLLLDKTLYEERFLTVARPKTYYQKPTEDEHHQQQVRTIPPTIKRLKCNGLEESSGLADISYDRQLHVSNTPTLPHAKLDIEQPLKWKEARTLFVGNVCPEMTEARLREFLFYTMKITGMIESTGKIPMADVEMLKGYALVTFNTPEEASEVLHMNHVPFLGAELRVERPVWWTQAKPTVKDWKDALRDHERSLREFDERVTYAPDDKLATKLMVTELPPRKKCSDRVLLDFLSSAIEQVGLNCYKGKPLKGFELFRKSPHVGFLEFRSAEEATRGLQLDFIPFDGSFLRLRRPSSWKGDRSKDPTRRWGEALADFFTTTIGRLEGGAISNRPGPLPPTPPFAMDEAESGSTNSNEPNLHSQRVELVKAQKSIQQKEEEDLNQVPKDLYKQIGNQEKRESEWNGARMILGDTKRRAKEKEDKGKLTNEVLTRELENAKQRLHQAETETTRLKKYLAATGKQTHPSPSNEAVEVLAKKLEDTEAKYRKMADSMEGAMGELIAQQSSYRSLQKEKDAEQQKRGEAEETIRKLKVELEAKNSNERRQQEKDAEQKRGEAEEAIRKLKVELKAKNFD
jgi:RNA recognition motif-containing protein